MPTFYGNFLFSIWNTGIVGKKGHLAPRILCDICADRWKSAYLAGMDCLPPGCCRRGFGFVLSGSGERPRPQLRRRYPKWRQQQRRRQGENQDVGKHPAASAGGCEMPTPIDFHGLAATPGWFMARIPRYLGRTVFVGGLRMTYGCANGPHRPAGAGRIATNDDSGLRQACRTLRPNSGVESAVLEASVECLGFGGRFDA